MPSNSNSLINIVKIFKEKVISIDKNTIIYRLNYLDSFEVIIIEFKLLRFFSKSPSNLSNISFDLLVDLDNFDQKEMGDFLNTLEEECEENVEIPIKIEDKDLKLKEEVEEQVEEEIEEDTKVLNEAISESASEEEIGEGEENHGTK